MRQGYVILLTLLACGNDVGNDELSTQEIAFLNDHCMQLPFQKDEARVVFKFRVDNDPVVWYVQRETMSDECERVDGITFGSRHLVAISDKISGARLSRTVTHELGHTINMQHNDSGLAVMNTSAGTDRLTAIDINQCIGLAECILQPEIISDFKFGIGQWNAFTIPEFQIQMVNE